MNNLLTVPSKVEADTLDVLSTPDNSHHNFDGENSPLFQTKNSEDGDSCSVSSKKIRKKRNAYQKIDDNIRIRLLESVQQGETLKSAAKRFNINYSSAKSILHTYRKEGRILKKSGQDKFFMGEDFPQNESGLTPEQILQSANMGPNPFLQQKMLVNPESSTMDLTMAPKIDLGAVPMSPSHGLAESFGSLLKLGSGNMISQHPTHPTSIFAKFSPRFSPSMMQASHEALNHQANILGINMSPANATNLSQMLQGNPLDKLKYYDNFYMNYSNSPLSGGGRLMTESTDSSKHSSSRPTSQFEFESFSEMVNALQNQPRQAEDIFVPPAIRMNTAQLLQDRFESKLGGGMEWEGSIENAAMDTYKSFMDAQLLLHDALKKASYLNNLVQIQKSKADGSPMFGQLQAFKNN